MQEQVGDDASRPRTGIVARRNVGRHIVADTGLGVVVTEQHCGHDEDEGGEEEVGGGIVGKGCRHHHHECRQHCDHFQGAAGLGYPGGGVVVVGVEHLVRNCWNGMEGKLEGLNAGSFCGGSDRYRYFRATPIGQKNNRKFNFFQFSMGQ